MSSNIELYNKIASLIEQARKHVASTINTAMVYTYYEIGRYIVEEEQQGEQRAAYGNALIEDLSHKLTPKYGKGFSTSNLEYMRAFYRMYSNSQTLSGKLSTSDNKVNTCSKITPKFNLSWSHYLVLIRIKSDEERRFYEIECKEQNWSVRQLQRQFNSSLYERLALSRDKNEVLRLAKEGQTVEKPIDIIKSPLALEFLGLKEEASYSETRLENAIISKLQDFLLELGKGFLFESRQKRFSFNEDSYYVDLVFYNRLLRCYVLIDLKIDKLSHQDLGQLQMYVNYYDRYVKQDFESPTIGILLCKEKNDALVELTLPKESNIHASEYMLYLPDKKLLKQKLEDWSEEFNQGGDKQ